MNQRIPTGAQRDLDVLQAARNIRVQRTPERLIESAKNWNAMAARTAQKLHECTNDALTQKQLRETARRYAGELAAQLERVEKALTELEAAE
jgi:hypothetical protein